MSLRSSKKKRSESRTFCLLPQQIRFLQGRNERSCKKTRPHFSLSTFTFEVALAWILPAANTKAHVPICTHLNNNFYVPALISHRLCPPPTQLSSTLEGQRRQYPTQPQRAPESKQRRWVGHAASRWWRKTIWVIVQWTNDGLKHDCSLELIHFCGIWMLFFFFFLQGIVYNIIYVYI